jgi:hypothetical protein
MGLAPSFCNWSSTACICASGCAIGTAAGAATLLDAGGAIVEADGGGLLEAADEASSSGRLQPANASVQATNTAVGRSTETIWTVMAAHRRCVESTAQASGGIVHAS